MCEPLGFCTLEMLKYNFARRSLVGQNESGLYLIRREFDFPSDRTIRRTRPINTRVKVNPLLL
ncbi:hypothetical protein T02_10976 [Trichinella nativa]|uniref:Uncharacterized protein n=1 Tax=Trichinella nativa TaxID=6335 RepID=A0A0V1KRC0_9BILA|nr:hypothetical protein T02_10976 [Trichinella nativa]